jgi:hypothetical protein
MNRNVTPFYFAALFIAVVSITGCGRNSTSGEEAAGQQTEEQRLQDQKERTALVERMKAEALAKEKKQEPIDALEKQIESLDVQIGDARARGKDCAALEKSQETLEAKKYELQH